MTSSNENVFCVTGHLCGEFTGPRWIPRTKASGAELWCFFDLRLNKRLSKQPWGRWFETLSCPLWRHRNVMKTTVVRPLQNIKEAHLTSSVLSWENHEAFCRTVICCKCVRIKIMGIGDHFKYSFNNKVGFPRATFVADKWYVIFDVSAEAANPLKSKKCLSQATDSFTLALPWSYK